MPYHVATEVLVGLLCAADLLLTVAVVRRLREHTSQLATLGAGGPPAQLLAVGSPLPAFSATSVDDATVDSATAQPAVVAFLSTTCRSCAEQLPELVDFLRADDRARDAAVVVVAGDDNAEGQRLVDQLRAVATVVREPRHGPVCHAFSTEIFPSFYLVSDGVVTANAISVTGLADPVPA